MPGDCPKADGGTSSVHTVRARLDMIVHRYLSEALSAAAEDTAHVRLIVDTVAMLYYHLRLHLSIENLDCSYSKLSGKPLRVSSVLSAEENKGALKTVCFCSVIRVGRCSSTIIPRWNFTQGGAFCV